MGTEARAEHLLAIWRGLQSIGDLAEQMKAVAGECRFIEELRGALRRAAEQIGLDLATCFESVLGIDSGITDLV